LVALRVEISAISFVYTAGAGLAAYRVTMRRARIMAVVLCAACALSGAAYAQATAKVAVATKAAAPRHFTLKPPPGFRPSDASVRLADVLGKFQSNGLWMHHVEMQPLGNGIHMGTRLLTSVDRDEHAGVAHVLGFAKQNGFTIETKGATPEEHHALREILRAHGAESIPIHNE
jgi:hypothetical protein